MEGSSHPLTCPSAAVLLAHIGAMLQQHPGALEVAQRGGQVQGSASSGVQLLNVGLPGRNEALRSLGWPDLALQCSHRCAAPRHRKQPTFHSIWESIPTPDLPQERHLKSLPLLPLPDPQRACESTLGAASTQHTWSQPGWAAPTRWAQSRGTARQWGAQMPLAQCTELCTSPCICKLQKSPHLWDLAGGCAQLPGSSCWQPPSARAGSCGGRTCSPA